MDRIGDKFNKLLTPFMPFKVHQDIHANIARLTTQDADPVRVADAAVMTGATSTRRCLRSSARGHALYKRSLHLTHAEHPCLAAVHAAGVEPSEFAALHAALARQTSSKAAAANGALLQAFCDLLANLIGVSLNEQLLRSV